MAKNVERDTHFQGWAKHVAEKLYGLDIFYEPGPEVDDIKEAFASVIAQAGYDLVYHVIENAGAIDLIPSTAAAVAVIPDLTEWPES